MSVPIWSPSPERVARANVTAFIRFVARNWDERVVDYDTLHAFSVDQLAPFHDALWQFLGIVGDKGSDIVIDPHRLPGAKWFPQAGLNFAENHLRRRDAGAAIIARSEDGARRVLSWGELYDAVSRAAQALTECGLRPGDRVAACLPNTPEAIIAMLAAASLGAIWSCCSPDYSEALLIDRLGQIEPRILFTADGYRYGGKRFSMRAKNDALARSLPGLERVIVVPFAGLGDPLPQSVRAQSWETFLGPYAPRDIEFQRFAFDHPLYLLYSSGTTGKPKAIIHGAGGCLLQLLKSVVLHYDLGRDELAFFPTTTGWMIWNIMVSALAAQAPLLLYDGSQTFPRVEAMLDLISEEQACVARIVPPLIDTYAKAGLHPALSHDLSSLKCLISGSAPLLAHQYEYVYSRIKRDLHLISPAGGTDSISSLATGNPAGPVYPGEIQVASLGMKVEIFDGSGRSLIGQPGELVCTRAFASVPLGFWGERSSERVRQAYFSMFPGVWRHGDWAEITPRGGIVIHGRSDATLKANGVRIGTAEIYAGLEHVTEVKEAVAIAHRIAAADRIVLFVVLGGERALDEALAARIRDGIRTSASARHVPHTIVQVPDIPRSLNGKPSELAVRDAVQGRAILNALGLSNPASLDFFRNIPALHDSLRD